MSTACSSYCWCGRYPCSCANARVSVPCSRTRTTPHAFGRYSHLCASTETESARSMPRNKRRVRRHRRGRHPVRTVHVEPDAALGADVRDLVDRIDRAGERGPGRGHDGDREDARRDVGDPAPRPARRAGGGAHPSIGMSRRLFDPMPKQLHGPRDRVVHLGRAVHGEPASRQAFGPGARERLLPGGRERGHVADRPAARERADRGREPDELAHPAHGLVLDLRGRARVDRQVDVVRVGQQVGDGADLQPRRADEREVPRTRLRDRLVEDARRVVERLVHRHGLARQSGAEEPAHALVERGLLRPVPVEAPPRLLHQLRRVREDLLARRVEPERSFELRHAFDGTAALRHPLPS